MPHSSGQVNRTRSKVIVTKCYKDIWLEGNLIHILQWLILINIKRNIKYTGMGDKKCVNNK